MESVGDLLDAGSLVDEARRRTGLRDFDDPPLEEALVRLTRALREEARLNTFGNAIWHDRLLNTLITRLRANDWFTRHPEILDEQVPPAVVILGLARTGTTLLQRLIAADERFYSAAWWEVRFPVPAAGDIAGNERIVKAKAEVEALLAAQPELAAIHPWDAMGADEDILLIDQTLCSTTAMSMACIPSYFEWIRGLDLRPVYSYLRKLLQLLQWQKRQRGELPRQYWVLKTPMHLGYVDVIDDVLPGSIFVQTHRDPVTTIPSFASFIHGLWASGSDSADAHEAGRQWFGLLAEHLDRCMDVRDRLPSERFIDIDFRDTVNQPFAVVERILDRTGLGMTEAARASIGTYMATHPREARPTHEYTLEQFGFTRTELEKRFDRYRRRHLGAD